MHSSKSANQTLRSSLNSLDYAKNKLTILLVTVLLVTVLLVNFGVKRKEIMETPFIYGKLAVSQNFTDREKEQNRLSENFTSLINTILISPRRWGKSSLVKKAADEVKSKNLKIHFCFLDGFNIRSEEDFYKSLAIEVLKASASKIDAIMKNAKIFLGKFLPVLSFSPDNLNSISLQLNWKEVRKNPDDILNMAEKIAIDKGCKFIICIDEFQNISTFENPLAFQKKLRSNWQKHQNTAHP